MGSLESRISKIEDYLHKKDNVFLTPRQRMEEISEKIWNPEHLGERNALVIEVEVNAFINSYKAIATFSEDKIQIKKCKDFIKLVEKSKLEKSRKQSLIARLKQCSEKNY